jgi:hypothetical protein
MESDMKNNETKSLLHTKYPDTYAEDDKTPWVPVTEELLRFLFTTRKENTTRLILALLFRRDYEVTASGTTSYLVTARHKTLAKMTGIHPSIISKCLGSVDFRDLVEVEDGTPATKSSPGTATTFSLRGVFEGLSKWRAEQALISEPVSAWERKRAERETKRAAALAEYRAAKTGTN